MIVENSREAVRRTVNSFKGINDRLAGDVISRLPVEQARKMSLGLASARGREITLPVQQKKSLKKRFDAQTIDDITPIAERLSQTVEDESRLGNKILDLDPFQKALDRNYRNLQLENPDQKAALEYWVKNIHQIPQDKGLFQEVKKIISGDILSSPLREVGIFLTLLKIRGGLSMKNSSGITKKVGDFLVDSSVTSSIKTQAREDIQGLTEVDNEDRREVMRDEVLARYGYERDSLQGRVFSHPDYFSRIGKSWGSTLTWYGMTRQVLGWGAFASMVKVPLPFTIPVINTDVITAPWPTVVPFQLMVDQLGVTQSTIISGGILAGLMVARMGVDCYVLKKRDMSPDGLETSLALSAGRVDEFQNLRANHKFGIVGPLVDVAISSLQPPYSAAWFVDSPYSVPAYLLAMGVDQLSFMGCNLGYLLWSRKSGNSIKTGEGK